MSTSDNTHGWRVVTGQQQSIDPFLPPSPVRSGSVEPQGASHPTEPKEAQSYRLGAAEDPLVDSYGGVPADLDIRVVDFSSPVVPPRVPPPLPVSHVATWGPSPAAIDTSMRSASPDRVAERLHAKRKGSRLHLPVAGIAVGCVVGLAIVAGVWFFSSGNQTESPNIAESRPRELANAPANPPAKPASPPTTRGATDGDDSPTNRQSQAEHHDQSASATDPSRSEPEARPKSNEPPTVSGVSPTPPKPESPPSPRVQPQQPTKIELRNDDWSTFPDLLEEMKKEGVELSSSRLVHGRIARFVSIKGETAASQTYRVSVPLIWELAETVPVLRREKERHKEKVILYADVPMQLSRTGGLGSEAPVGGIAAQFAISRAHVADAWYLTKASTLKKCNSWQDKELVREQGHLYLREDVYSTMLFHCYNEEIREKLKADPRLSTSDYRVDLLITGLRYEQPPEQGFFHEEALAEMGGDSDTLIRMTYLGIAKAGGAPFYFATEPGGLPKVVSATLLAAFVIEVRSNKPIAGYDGRDQ